MITRPIEANTGFELASSEGEGGNWSGEVMRNPNEPCGAVEHKLEFCFHITPLVTFTFYKASHTGRHPETASCITVYLKLSTDRNRATKKA